MIKYLFFVTLFIGIAFGAVAQKNRVTWEYNYDHFGIQNGLPSSETYQVYQDKSGLLWILTDRGVVRYDGFRFKTYTTENGLCDNVNFRVVEDSNGRLWFLGYNCKLSVYKNGEMQAYRFNNKLNKAIPIRRTGNLTIHINPDGSIICSVVGKKTIAISKTGEVTDLMVGMPDAGYIFDFGTDLLIQKTIDNNNLKKVFLVRGKKKALLGKIVFNQILRAKKHKEHYFVLADSKVYLHDRRGFKVISDNQSVIGLDCDDQFLYIGYYKNGVKKYRFDPKTKELFLVKHYLPNCSVSSIFKDKNDALWLTTLEKGIFVLYDEAFQQLFVNGSKLNEEIRFLSGNKNKIILTYYVGKWQQLYPPFLYKDEGKINFHFYLLPHHDGFAFSKGVVDWSGWKDVDDSYNMMPSYCTDTSILGPVTILGVTAFTPELVEIGKKSVTRYSYRDWAGSGRTGSYYWFHFYRKDKLFMLFHAGVFVLSVKNGKIQKSYRPVLLKGLDRLVYNRVWGLLHIQPVKEFLKSMRKRTGHRCLRRI